MQQGGVMQIAITFIAVVAGLVLSLAVALVAEELIFGQVMRVFFRHSIARTAVVRSGLKR
jgi:hypothetical protein